MHKIDQSSFIADGQNNLVHDMGNLNHLQVLEIIVSLFFFLVELTKTSQDYVKME